MALNINERSKVLLGKVQAAKGTAETLAAADMVRTSNLSMSIYDGDTATTNYDGGTGRNDFDRHTTFYNKFNFEMDLIGGGDNGGTDINPPPAADFLRACGWDMDASVANQRTFSIADRSNIDVATLGVNRRVAVNGTNDFRVYRYDTYDARGSVGLSFNDDRPKFVFNDFTGIYTRPYEIASSMIGTDLTGNFVSPRPFIDSSFTSLTFNGEALCTHSLDIPSLGWNVVPLDKVNCADVNLQEQKMMVDLTFKQLDFTTEFNPFEFAEDHLNQNYYTFEFEFDDRVGHIFRVNATARMKNAQETALEDGNVGVTAQLEVQDDDLTFGWYAA